jgi:hypothetical protein
MGSKDKELCQEPMGYGHQAGGDCLSPTSNLPEARTTRIYLRHSMYKFSCTTYFGARSRVSLWVNWTARARLSNTFHCNKQPYIYFIPPCPGSWPSPVSWILSSTEQQHLQLICPRTKHPQRQTDRFPTDKIWTRPELVLVDQFGFPISPKECSDRWYQMQH